MPGPRPTKVLTVRELQMAKRMLKPKKAAACQRELNALLTAMERKENGEANVNIRMLQTALEHCLHQAVSTSYNGEEGINRAANVTVSAALRLCRIMNSSCSSRWVEYCLYEIFRPGSTEGGLRPLWFMHARTWQKEETILS